MENENKTNKNDQKDIVNVPEKLSKSFLFQGKNYFIYIYKKSEKVANVLYVLSSFFHDSEPIKKVIKDKALSFLTKVSELISSKSSVLNDKIKETHSLILELISLCEISLHSGLVTSGNMDIIKRELHHLMDVIGSVKDRSEEMNIILDENFFNDGSDRLLVMDNKNKISASAKDKVGYKGQTIKDKEMSFKKPSIRKMSQRGDGNEPKQDRNKIILDLFSKFNEINVKDVSQVIKDCSEKTLQRELLEMVKNGVLKKTGDRRWSRYSLVQKVS